MATEETTETEETKEVTFTPEQLAKELGVDGKRIRAWLRKEYPRTAEEHRTTWSLTEERAAAVRKRFSPKKDEDVEEVNEESDATDELADLEEVLDEA